MRLLPPLILAGTIAGLIAAGVATGKGEPPITPPDPPPYTVIARGIATAPVGRPWQQTNASFDRAVRDARAKAMPLAIARAREEAKRMAAAAGLRLGQVVGAARDAPPAGSWDPDAGQFGPGIWCGRIYVGRRTVTGADGRTRNVNRYRDGCKAPKQAAARVSLTFAAVPR